MTTHVEDEPTLKFPARTDTDRPRGLGSMADATADLPPVMITSNDARRLRTLLAEARDGTDAAVLRFLARELDRAALCQPDMMPPDIVTMNSRVFFRRHIDQPIQSRTLVYDEEYAVLGGTISVFTPLGAALLGLRDGSQMPYVSREGERYVAVVERVAYQPEGEGRLQRAPYRYWPQTGLAGHGGHTAQDGKEDRTVVPMRPRVQPRPKPAQREDDDPVLREDENDDPGPNNAA